MSALIGDTDPKVTLDEVLAWRDHTAGEFRHRVFPGGHFYLNAHNAAVIAEIRTLLGEYSVMRKDT